jgi:hypothetical protein
VLQLMFGVLPAALTSFVGLAALAPWPAFEPLVWMVPCGFLGTVGLAWATFSTSPRFRWIIALLLACGFLPLLWMTYAAAVNTRPTVWNAADTPKWLVSAWLLLGPAMTGAYQMYRLLTRRAVA